MCILIHVFMCFFVCRKNLPPSYFPAFRGPPWITVGECERTHTLHGEMLYATTSSAAPDASVGASIGAPQVVPRLALFSCIRAFV